MSGARCSSRVGAFGSFAHNGDALSQDWSFGERRLKFSTCGRRRGGWPSLWCYAHIKIKTQWNNSQWSERLIVNQQCDHVTGLSHPAKLVVGVRTFRPSFCQLVFYTVTSLQGRTSDKTWYCAAKRIKGKNLYTLCVSVDVVTLAPSPGLTERQHWYTLKLRLSQQRLHFLQLKGEEVITENVAMTRQVQVPQRCQRTQQNLSFRGFHRSRRFSYWRWTCNSFIHCSI